MEVGKARETELRAAPGLTVLIGDEAENLRVDRALQTELGVDVVLRMHFVVGVEKGRGSIEPGSTVYITRSTDSGSIVSQRSLRSNSTVLRSLATVPNTQGESIVESEIFIEQVRTNAVVFDSALYPGLNAERA